MSKSAASFDLFSLSRVDMWMRMLREAWMRQSSFDASMICMRPTWRLWSKKSLAMSLPRLFDGGFLVELLLPLPVRLPPLPLRCCSYVAAMASLSRTLVSMSKN